MRLLVSSTPEGVSVMTVIIDGVDAASSGLEETCLKLPGASGKTLGHYDPSALNG